MLVQQGLFRFIAGWVALLRGKRKPAVPLLDGRRQWPGCQIRLIGSQTLPKRFVCADSVLVQVARGEGLAVVNPLEPQFRG